MYLFLNTSINKDKWRIASVKKNQTNSPSCIAPSVTLPHTILGHTHTHTHIHPPAVQDHVTPVNDRSAASCQTLCGTLDHRGLWTTSPREWPLLGGLGPGASSPGTTSDTPSLRSPSAERRRWGFLPGQAAGCNWCGRDVSANLSLSKRSLRKLLIHSDFPSAVAHLCNLPPGQLDLPWLLPVLCKYISHGRPTRSAICRSTFRGATFSSCGRYQQNGKAWLISQPAVSWLIMYVE